MDKAFEPLVKALDAISTAILAVSPGHPNTMNATHGWNQPALTLAELAAFATRLVAEIREFGADDVDDANATSLAGFAERVDQIRSTTVPQLWGGNGVHAIPAYLTTISFVREGISNLLHKNVPIDPRAPARLAKRVVRMSAELDEILVDRETLTERMRTINEAYETADSLPEDLASLQEAREKVEKLATGALRDAEQISKHEKDAFTAVGVIGTFGEEAEKLVLQCEEAYRVTTSKGLAGAFDQRASGLSRSMQLWVLALVVALGAAAYLGGQRVELLSRNLAEVDPKWGVIVLNFALSLLSVGAPLWFAWVATKQIGQRFRLAEDYGYKASIAKAYEGYRREAAKLDPEFTARLFGSSLTRLEEAPLRLMENASHGSPLHELMNSTRVQDAMTTVPAFREKMLALLSEAQTLVIPKKPAASPLVDKDVSKEE
ncbi:hypothetical protein J7E70_26425 [Variovorax paradoxus]|nr:hypothetical protein [Variovorax paradoxus]MBT2303983.1 hypothetical protein [Variovorax paradoxus]